MLQRGGLAVDHLPKHSPIHVSIQPVIPSCYCNKRLAKISCCGTSWTTRWEAWWWRTWWGLTTNQNPFNGNPIFNHASLMMFDGRAWVLWWHFILACQNHTSWWRWWRKYMVLQSAINLTTPDESRRPAERVPYCRGHHCSSPVGADHGWSKPFSASWRNRWCHG